MSTVISVVTPTFNRAHLLGRLYASLCEQTFSDFEWLVVDDGSTDDTAAQLERWQREGRIALRTLKQANSGKHVALNRAAEHADATFCAVIDSDDWYKPEALERLVHHWNAIPTDQQAHFANVEGLRAYADGRLIGSPFPNDVLDSDTFEVRYCLGVTGDTVGMYRTDVLRLFPFPENLGRFVPEALVWSRIASVYRSRFINEVLGFVEYQPGGLSDRGLAQQVHAAPAWSAFYGELAATPRQLPSGTRLRASAQHVRYMLHARSCQPFRPLYRPLWLAGVPIGVGLYLRDRRRLSRR
ncbi:MAG TPA: glycosyltransferase family 2 protein [Chloroflexota bacterium]